MFSRKVVRLSLPSSFSIWSLLLTVHSPARPGIDIEPPVLLHTMRSLKTRRGYQTIDQMCQPFSTRSWPKISSVRNVLHTQSTAISKWIKPAARKVSISIATQQVGVDLVKDGIIVAELPSERCIAICHTLEVIKVEKMGMLLWRIVPWDKMQVVVDRRVAKLVGVANDSVEIALRRWEEVGIIHKDYSWEIVPSP